MRMLGWLLFAIVMIVWLGALHQKRNFEPHLNPAEADAPMTPNWALAAPRGEATKAAPTIETPVWRYDPETLIAALDKVALAEPWTEIVAAPEGGFGAGDPLARTYKQRTATVGFPDYVTVLAAPQGEGASLIMLSRSVYGISDRGVNRARLERWIAALD